MMVRPFALSIAVAIVLTACSGGGRTSTTPATSQPALATPSGSGALTSGFAYNSADVALGKLVGSATLGKMTVDVNLPLRDASGLHAYALSVSDPTSGNYRHFLTPDQIADRFAATTTDRDNAITYFHSHHLVANGWRERATLAVSGAQSDMEAAFHTKFGTFLSPTGSSFVAPMSPPAVSVGVPVTGSADIVRIPKLVNRSIVTSTGTSVGYSPQQIATAFDFDGAYAAGFTGAGITVGIVATGPIQGQTGGRVGDFEYYRQTFHAPGSSDVVQVDTTASDPVVDGNSGFSSPPPVTPYCTGDLPSCNGEDGEAQLDTQQIAGLAKDSHVEFYIAYNGNDGCTAPTGSACAPGAGSPSEGIDEYPEELQTIIDHNTADVVSISIGQAESGSGPNSYAPVPDLLAMLVSEGVAIFVSSGDQGANTCQSREFRGSINYGCVSYPATDPSVVAVGGTTTPLDGTGNFLGPVTAWGLQTSAGTSGTAGGVSADFTQPTFQMGLPGIIGSTRNVPDVALEGDPSTGVATVSEADPSLGGPYISPIGGTSVAAPEMAAMWATVLQACKMTPSCVAAGSGPRPYRMGNPNPLFYSFYAHPQIYATTFLPIFYGNNGLANFCYYPGAKQSKFCPSPAPGTTATPMPVPIPVDSGYSANSAGGYNNLTGIGVPFARALIRSVVGV